MARIARWCAEHRLLVVLFWVVGIVGLGVANSAAGSKYADNFSLPGTESTKALSLLQQNLPSASGDSDTIVWKVSSGTVRDTAVEQRMTTTLDQIAKLPSVASVTSPYTATSAKRVSSDGKVAYATVSFNKLANALNKTDVQKVIDTAQAADNATIQVQLGGQAIEFAQQQPSNASTIIGVLAAAVILFFAFGSLASMLLPIATALAGLGTGLSLIPLLSHAMAVSSISSTLSTLIGLGVGIDYALFIVTRHRTGLKRGLGVRESVVRALDTSGRAVLFAGATVCIALLGMFVLGLSFLNGVAVAAAITVLCTVLGAVTLLPALLSLLGMKVLSRRERRKLAEQGPAGEATSGFWFRWSNLVQRHPRALAALAAVVMAVLILPAVSLRLGSSDQGNDPSSTTTRKAYDLLAEGFGPGFNGPLQLVAQVHSAADRAAVTSLAETLRGTSGVASVSALPLSGTSPIEVLFAYPTTSPQSKSTSDLITHLRSDVIPAAEKGSTAKVYIGGQTAIYDDFAHVLLGKIPAFIAVIVALGCLLLLFAFRSLLVPAVAAVMNLLAAAAAFGVIVAFFQFGWGSQPLGMGASGPIESFLPVIMLSILFGLSMDYQVFLVSRMHEEWVHTRDNARAVRVGQAETGRVITAAATIMICVFVSFVLIGQRVIAEFGIGLAAAVALDAFVLRTVLVPAVMHSLGSSNWWLPGWLDKRLPHLSVEPADDAVPPPHQAGSGAGYPSDDPSTDTDSELDATRR